MPDLTAEFVDLLSWSGSRWQTIRADGREWRNESLLREAWDARSTRIREGVGSRTWTTDEGTIVIQSSAFIEFGSARDERATPEDTEKPWRLWIAPPWTRAQFMGGGAMVDVVFHGSRWWSNIDGASITNGGRDNCGHGEGSGIYLIRTARYPSLLQVHETRLGTWLDRATIETLVTPRNDINGLMIGDADDLLVSVDRERGVLLRVISRFNGSAYRIIEMTDVGFDEEFPPSTFEIEPLPGQRWREA